MLARMPALLRASRFGARPSAVGRRASRFGHLAPPIRCARRSVGAMNPANVNYLGALVGALCCFLVGGVWYSPILFARPWMRASGLTEDGLKKGNMGRIFGGAFALALVGNVNLAFFLADGTPSLAWGVAAGALAGVGWVATSLGITYLFERRPLALYLIDAGYHVVTFVISGAILGVWKK